MILQAAKALKPDGTAYFTVYEGNGSGEGEPSKRKDSWQNNRKTADYVDEIKRHFADVVRHGKIIEARNPITDDKTSVWFNRGFSEAPAMFQEGRSEDSDVPRINRPDFLKLTAEVDRQRAEVRKKYKGTPAWMKAPNGEPTNLTEDQWTTVRTPFFKAWFGDWEKAERRTAGHPTGLRAPETPALSPAPLVSGPQIYNTPDYKKSQESLLDENGEPLLVWHGTLSRFGTFSRGDIGFHFGSNSQARNRVSAIDYDGERVPYDNAGLYAGFLKLNNPLYIDTDFGNWDGDYVADRILDLHEGGYVNLSADEVDALINITKHPVLKANREISEWLKGNGYDGIVYENRWEFEGEGKSYVIFDANQFKEAQNLGTFSPNDHRFYYQSAEDSKRGAFDPVTRTLHLFEAADVSTFSHETIHYFMDLLRCFQMDGLLNEQYAKDLDALERFATDKDGNYDEEKIAVAWEHFLMKGKVDNLELRPVFRKFREWLMDLYRCTTNYFKGNCATPEVKDIFNRWLAADEGSLSEVGDNPVIQSILKYSLLGMNNRDRAGRAAKECLQNPAGRARTISPSSSRNPQRR